MRLGQNPVKQLKTVAKPERVTAAVLNHIPFLDGFYAEMLKVLDASLSSLRDNAGMPFDLLVFDNASCSEAQNYLLQEYEEGRIQTLILSDRNVGKGGGWNVMLQAAPGEIIAYADNDVLYHPNWLVESVKILETFPNAGMVTSRPFHSLPQLYSANLEWAARTPEVKVERGHFTDPQWGCEFWLSVGRTEEEITAILADEEVRLTYKSVSAFCGASHWQFLSWKSILQKFLPVDLSKPLGQVLRMDEMINENGYLRLMTPEPYTMNMSNTLDLPANTGRKTEETKPSRNRLVDHRLIKSPLMRIYNAIFRLYYDDRAH